MRRETVKLGSGTGFSATHVSVDATSDAEKHIYALTSIHITVHPDE